MTIERAFHIIQIETTLKEIDRVLAQLPGGGIVYAIIHFGFINAPNL